MDKNNIGTVWKLLLSPNEEKELLETLELNKLPKTEAGMKELFFKAIAPEEKGASKISSFLQDNPEAVDLATKGMSVVGGIIRRKIFGP